MTKIYFIGDIHADFKMVEPITKFVQENGGDYIVQLGDFGFGFYTLGDGRDSFLTDVSRVAVEYDLPWYWIDGNHDNHRRIWREVNEETYPATFYMNRGTVHNLGGIKIGALGGAVSIDRNSRKPDVDWWDTETITGGQMNRALYTFLEDKPDVIVTHDAPSGFPVMHDDYPPTPGTPMGDAKDHRKFLQGLYDNLLAYDHLPPLWIHGHMHHKYVDHTPRCSRIGVGQSDSYGLREVEDVMAEPLWWSYVVDR